MTDFKKILGLRLKAVRKAANFKSARAFAEKANMPPTTYAQHESGKRAINIETLLHYCDVLNIDPLWLIFGGDKPYITKTAQDSLLVSASHTIDQLYKPIKHGLIQPNATMAVDMKLYNEIVAALLTVIKTLQISEKEATDFCVDVYNSIATTSADDEARKKMIDLSISSLARGYNKQREEYKLKVSEK